MTCSIANCGNRVRARGWCNGHYERWRKTGDPPGTAVLEQRRKNAGRRCDVESCSRAAIVRRMCESHYARWKQHGDPGNTPIQEAESIEARFWQKVDKSGDCWEWIGAVSSGYGHFQTDGGTTTAHRVAYQLLVGPIPDGLHVDHLCRNTLCVNPDHLEPVTQAENNRRAALVRTA